MLRITSLTLAILPQHTHRSPPPRALLDPAPWSEWSLRDVGLLDGAVLGLVASGILWVSGRGETSGLEADYTRDPNELAGIWPLPSPRGGRREGPSRSARSADPRMRVPAPLPPPITPLLSDLDLPAAELQALLRADIQRRLDELFALSWLGRAYAAAPWLVGRVAPSAFALEQYEGEDLLCCEYRGEGGRGGAELTLRESSVVARGVPFRLRVDGSNTAGEGVTGRGGAAGGSSPVASPSREPAAGGGEAAGGTSAAGEAPEIPPETLLRLTGIGCDVLRATEGHTGSSPLPAPAAAALAKRVSSSPRARRRLASVVSDTIFQRLSPVARAVTSKRRVEACGAQVRGCE